MKAIDVETVLRMREKFTRPVIVGPRENQRAVMAMEGGVSTLFNDIEALEPVEVVPVEDVLWVAGEIDDIMTHVGEGKAHRIVEKFRTLLPKEAKK